MDRCRSEEDNLTAEEKKASKKEREEEERANVITSGTLLIMAFFRLQENDNNGYIIQYFEQVLHSIFFFGYINKKKILPEDFLPEEVISQLKNLFPKPFREYNTHLPYYTPYSILLEYMTRIIGAEDPDLFMQELTKVNQSLWKVCDEQGNQPIANDFAATASTVSYCCVIDTNNGKVLEKAYGASMSCKGKIQREIMIALSALHVWDKAISYAVSSKGKHPITFPDRVHCRAYSIIAQRGAYKEKRPCKRCNQLYKVNFIPGYEADNREYPYGNCAENESLSRLLQAETNIRNEIFNVGDNGEKLNREAMERKFKDEYEGEKKCRVKALLSSMQFKLNPQQWNFFTPSSSV
ncbi:uncharacterized protein LOC122941399 isoform X1 [Bufo gargarizans]|uniref:uncharacterized protein LOC122941399 isoform X1 n=2 Tax=Bufo gargarizans TaxID=30331 RepID=UPI001CF4D42E|nr:uncharacterized protein LOC122941399 isoform X1 [Bufo gargarizans]